MRNAHSDRWVQLGALTSAKLKSGDIITLEEGPHVVIGQIHGTSVRVRRAGWWARLRAKRAVGSYTATRLGLTGRLKEALALYRHHAAGMPSQVTEHLKMMRTTQSVIESALGQPLEDQSILEIGPGQQLKQARYFAARNRVVAIDLDEIQTSLSPLALLRALRVNGPVRFAKTLVRKVVGLDRRLLKEMIRQRPETRGSTPQVLRCDATRTGLPSNHFDVAMSTSVFEHLPYPAAVFREIGRLLRPGGVSHHVIHLYTSDTGAHDARSFVEPREFPYWCHLRPSVQHQLASNCYVNKLSLRQWLEVIETECPGSKIEYFHSSAACREALKDIRSELAAYTDVELMTACLSVTWRKPEIAHDREVKSGSAQCANDAMAGEKPREIAE